MVLLRQTRRLQGLQVDETQSANQYYCESISGCFKPRPKAKGRERFTRGEKGEKSQIGIDSLRREKAVPRDRLWADHDERCRGDIERLVDNPNFEGGMLCSCYERYFYEEGCRRAKHFSDGCR